ncbi:hypothetical protein FOHLNKBM_1131 [Methylobacterium longum]|nr:hypothetical protein FOHLNKBM_1131 [Methylobacterium longum]
MFLAGPSGRTLLSTATPAPTFVPLNRWAGVDAEGIRKTLPTGPRSP